MDFKAIHVQEIFSSLVWLDEKIFRRNSYSLIWTVVGGQPKSIRDFFFGGGEGQRKMLHHKEVKIPSCPI